MNRHEKRLEFVRQGVEKRDSERVGHVLRRLPDPFLELGKMFGEGTERVKLEAARWNERIASRNFQTMRHTQFIFDKPEVCGVEECGTALFPGVTDVIKDDESRFRVGITPSGIPFVEFDRSAPRLRLSRMAVHILEVHNRSRMIMPSGDILLVDSPTLRAFLEAPADQVQPGVRQGSAIIHPYQLTG